MSNFLTRYQRRPVRWSSSQPSQTIQSDMADTLIPNIFAQHGLDALATHKCAPMFGDFTSAPTGLQDAYNRILDAQVKFFELPSAVRERFANDPMQLLAFLMDPRNRPEAEKLGLVNVSPAAPAAPAGQAGGTLSSLDVTVPGDTNPLSSTPKPEVR